MLTGVDVSDSPVFGLVVLPLVPVFVFAISSLTVALPPKLNSVPVLGGVTTSYQIIPVDAEQDVSQADVDGTVLS